MARKPAGRSRGYVVVNPNKAIFPPGAPVGPYPGQTNTPTPPPQSAVSFGAMTAVFGSTTLRFGPSA